MPIPPPPEQDSPGFKDWLFRLWKRISDGIFETLTVTGNTTLGDDATDTITMGAGVWDVTMPAARFKFRLTDIPRSNRTMFMSRDLNTGSNVGVIPNGTSNVSAWTAFGSSDPDNCHFINIATGATSTVVNSTAVGTGTQRALEFQIGSSTKLTIDTSGNATFTGTVAASAYSTAGQYTSTVATGTAPLVISSATLVPNLYVARSALADTVTTNANLTGPITSSGNATSIASQTGTGTKFVVDNTPTLITPVIGAATGTSLAATGLIKSSGTAGIGYATGAGGTATQSVSKTNSISGLDKTCGQITMASTALAAGAKATFQVGNNTVVTTDIPVVCVVSGGTADAYRASVTSVTTGSFKITVENITAGSLSESPVIGFAVIKGVTS